MLTAAVVVGLFHLLGCGDESCLRSDGSDCTIVSPCSELHFECDDRTVSAVQITPDTTRPGGLGALATSGDYLLTNSVITAVFDGLDHPHLVAPTGGNLIDLVTNGDDNDSFNVVFHGVGLLPGDAASYEEAGLVEGEGFVALEVHGHLDGFPDVPVHTRYEIRACEPGVRVRTEIINRSPDELVWVLVDGWYWGGKETIPFAPGNGQGFDQSGLVDPIEDSFVPFPYMAAASHTTPNAAYTCVPCNVTELYGFHSEQLSASGLEPRVVPPRDYEVFERFIGVADGSSLSGVTDIALELRRQLHDEPWAELSGQLDADDLGAEARATVHISEGTTSMEASERTPWTQVTPGSDGRFSVRVPANRDYVVEVEAFTRRVASTDVHVGSGSADAGAISVEPAGELELVVTVDGVADETQVFVHPGDDATSDAVTGHFLGGFSECAPLLGSPYGPSPACNRVLVNEPTIVQIPAGTYDLFATAGPFATLAHQRVTIAGGERETVELDVQRLPVQPEGTLSADLHVHGSVSFDSSIPDEDRVRAFLASGIDVIAATDHDVSHDYADAIAALGADTRMRLMVGVEATGSILFDLTPEASLPQVIGHWNFWPLEYQPDGPFRGAVWDELAEPGTLMTRFVQEVGWSYETGVAQMNHPWDEQEFGRDLGFPRAVGLDARQALPVEYDGTGQGLILRTPPGSEYSNADYHVQEVMNGSANRSYLAYREVWFYLLNQGVLRVGTANSDSHSLTDNVVATPRNLIWTTTTHATFDDDQFNADLRAGHSMGTNGPVIEVFTVDAQGEERRPDLEPFEPASDGALNIRVTAAPWVPVEEIRIIVNGDVAHLETVSPSLPDDPYGTEGVLRYEDEISLAPLLPSTGDAWIVIEVGSPLAENDDLDCNGIPDTGDNTGDGVIDWRDVDRNGDDVVDGSDLTEIEEAPTCSEDIGPMVEPPVPERGQPGYAFRAVTPRGYPAAFTNPLVLDLDGGGFAGPGGGL